MNKYIFFYILFMDPDDMYLNANLFNELMQYNEKNNLDIIEFVVYEQNNGGNKIYILKMISNYIIIISKRILFINQNYPIFYIL